MQCLTPITICVCVCVCLFFFSCDCYILKDILQNWSDEDASLILNNLYEMVKPGQRVLIIETVMHTGSFSEERVSKSPNLYMKLFLFNVPQFKSLMDLTMMAFNPAHSRLRTEEEIYFLLEQSGFVDTQTYPTRASYAIIESFPSPQ